MSTTCTVQWFSANLTLNVGAFEKNMLNKDNGVHMYDTKSLRDVIIQDNKFF